MTNLVCCVPMQRHFIDVCRQQSTVRSHHELHRSQSGDRGRCDHNPQFGHQQATTACWPCYQWLSVKFSNDQKNYLELLPLFGNSFKSWRIFHNLDYYGLTWEKLEHTSFSDIELLIFLRVIVNMYFSNFHLKKFWHKDLPKWIWR